jgi:nicotinamide-nucleotide amidase
VSTSEEQVVGIANLLKTRGWQVAVAESLTCGRILSTLGAGPDAATWLAGGIVAYRPEIKFALLEVSRGPVITAACAREMASGVAERMRSQVSVAVTGCGGPDPEEGRAPGTVFIATSVQGRVAHHGYTFGGGPEAVLESTVHQALERLHAALADSA